MLSSAAAAALCSASFSVLQTCHGEPLLEHEHGGEWTVWIAITHDRRYVTTCLNCRNSRASHIFRRAANRTVNSLAHAKLLCQRSLIPSLSGPAIMVEADGSLPDSNRKRLQQKKKQKMDFVAHLITIPAGDSLVEDLTLTNH